VGGVDFCTRSTVVLKCTTPYIMPVNMCITLFNACISTHYAIGVIMGRLLNMVIIVCIALYMVYIDKE